MRRLSLLHSPVFFSSVKAEIVTAINHFGVVNSISDAMTSIDNEPDIGSLPDETVIPHINVVMIRDDDMTRKDLSKATRALHDTGADDCTTNNPFILHNLRLLPEDNWLTLYDAGHNPHLSKYSGNAKLCLASGEIKEFFMRYTPTMPVTVIDVSKMRKDAEKCVMEGIRIHHVDKQYNYVWQYEDTDPTIA